MGHYRKRKVLAMVFPIFALLFFLRLNSKLLKSHELQQRHVAESSANTDPTKLLQIVNSNTATYEFNQDVTLSAFLHQIYTQDQKQPQELPFHWYDWVDLSVLNNFINFPSAKKFDCTLLCAADLNSRKSKQIDQMLKDPGAPMESVSTRQRKAKANSRCQDYCRNDNSRYQPGFRIFRNLFKGNKMLKSYQSRSYLFSEAPNPSKLVFTTSQGKNLQYLVKPNKNLNDHSEQNILRSKMYENLLSDTQNSKIDVAYHYKQMINLIDSTEMNPEMIDLDTQYEIDLDHEDFFFDAPSYIKEHPDPSTLAEKNFQSSLQHSLHQKDSILPKYFLETLLTREGSNMKSSHIDWRFFNGEVGFSTEHKREVLTKMLKTWYQFTLNEGIASFLAHGGLLAHDFNGILFPYDDDLDIQMPYNDLIKLAAGFNQSLVVEDPSQYDESTEPVKKRTFFLDVTNSITHRSKGNGLNNIDARFIDVETGLFIDITGLGVSASVLPVKFRNELKELKKKQTVDGGELIKDPNVVIDDFYENWNDKDKDALQKSDPYHYRVLKKNQYYSKPPRVGLTTSNTPEERFDYNYRLKIYNCRNNHYYQLEDLAPLRKSYFNGVPILIPNNFEKVLSEEYRPQNLLTTIYKEWVFLPQLRIWVPVKVMKDLYKLQGSHASLAGYDMNLLTKDELFEVLKTPDVALEYLRNWEMTLLNDKRKLIWRDLQLNNTLVEDLLKDREFSHAIHHFLASKSEEQIYSMAVDQLELELSGNIDFNKIARDPTKEYYGELDFNSIGWTSNDLLKLYSENKFDPDVDLKMQNLEAEIKSKQKEETKKALTERLTALAEKKQARVLNDDSALPHFSRFNDYYGSDVELDEEEEVNAEGNPQSEEVQDDVDIERMLKDQEKMMF